MTLKVGIIGGGIRGQLFAEALLTRDEITVSGIADPAQERLTWAEGIAKFPDHGSLLESVDVDALIVATPDFAHFDAVIAGAKRGLPLLVEKPLTTNVDEALELEEVCAGTQVMVGFENRWNPMVRAIHDVATSTGTLAWQSIELSNTMEVPLRMLGWASKSSPAWFLMPHTVDLALWVTGECIVSVQATTGAGQLQDRGVDTIDWIQAQVTFESGSSCQFTSSWILPDGNEPIVEFRYAANTVGASIRADVIRGESSVTRSNSSATSLSLLPPQRGGAELSAPQAMVHEFADRLLQGQVLQPGIEHGVEVTKVIGGMLRSAGVGQPVSF